MGSGVPLLNDYKLDFLLKRLPQTILGGPRLRLGFCAPAYVYLSQLLLFLMPWLASGTFTLLVELNALECNAAVYAYGTLMCAFVLALSVISEVTRQNREPVSQLNSSQNVLSEDDEIEFISCCGIKTIQFVLPAKRFKINILLHALFSGPLCGLGFWYLLPKTLNGLYSDSLAVTVLLYAFGWACLCIAQYSLTVAPPPETAIYRTGDKWEIAALMRPFYVMIFFAIDVLARHFPEFVQANKILHILFVFLPVLWTAGILPPLDALLLWLLEQMLCVAFGGSAMATNLRLVINVSLSATGYVAACLIPYGWQTVVVMAGCGYLLSIDLGSLGSQLCFPTAGMESLFQQANFGFLWKWTAREMAFHMVMLGVAASTAAAVNVVTENSTMDATDYLAYSIVGLLVLELILAELQKVYMFCGQWRNQLYPSSVRRTVIFQRGRRWLRVLGYIRRVVINFGSPPVMLAYLATSIHFDDDGAATSKGPATAAVVLGSCRAFRWIWQSTHNALLEISVAHLLKVNLADDSSWLELGIGIQLLIVGLCRDRLFQLLNKLYLFLTILITSWTDKKQRRNSTASTIGLNLFFFPVVFAMIAVAAALSAPLLPLFTLPVFLIGYPRPLRSWPEAVGSSANVCDDTVYYKHFAPQLALALRTAYASGSLGDPSPGQHYLVRFQDRLAWIQILERGYCYCNISMKGLELQETSCHTVEAARIDDIFELAFEFENAIPCCTWNDSKLHIICPCDAAIVETYSDARSQLTGIIDSPDVLEMVDEDYMKALIWVFLHHVAQTKRSPTIGGSLSSGGGPVLAKPMKESGGETSGHYEHSLQAKTQHSKASLSETPGPKVVRTASATSAMSRSTARSASLKSFSDSLWSNSLGLEPVEKSGKERPNLIASQKPHQTRDGVLDKVAMPNIDVICNPPAMPPGLMTEDKDFKDLFKDIDLGMPVMDVKQVRKTAQEAHPTTGGVTLLDSSIQFQSPQSLKLSLPVCWQQIPIEPSQLVPYLARFPREWYQHVVHAIGFEAANQKTAEETTMEMAEDDVLMKMYSQFVTACYAMVNVLGLGGSDPVSLGPSHVHKVYSGNIPWSPALDWVMNDGKLLELIVKAYRYSVKLAIDQVVLGVASGHQELQEYLEDYDRECYVGLEQDVQWSRAVVQGKPQLFSFTYDPMSGSYNSRTLTCQATPIYIGRLNSEAVRGQWANLNLELLYLTNDDEERYSIQAQTNLLRNLTVQAADPPLGYPIYASEPISMPML